MLKLVALTVYLEAAAFEGGSCVFRDVKNPETLPYKFCGVFEPCSLYEIFLGKFRLDLNTSLKSVLKTLPVRQGKSSASRTESEMEVSCYI